MSFTPRSFALRYGAAPMKAGRNEWWMLITGTPTSSRKSSERICMYRASTTKSTLPFEQLDDLRLGGGLVRPLRGHVEERDAERADVLGGVGVVGDHHRDA